MALSGNFYTTKVSTSNSNAPNRTYFSWEVTNNQADRIENNRSIVAWRLRMVGGTNAKYWTNVASRELTVQGKVVGSATAVKQIYHNEIIWSGTTTINHNNDGTGSFSASARLAIFSYGSYNSTGSGSWALDTIPRASTITTFNNFTIGNSIPWEVDRKASAYTHYLRLSVAGTTIKNFANITTASGTMTFTTAEKNAMLALTPNGATATATLQVFTYRNGTQTSANQVGSTQSKNATATVGSDILPSLTSISVSELNSNVASKIGAYVQSLTRLKVTADGVKAGQGSSVQSTRIVVAGYTINGTTGDTGVINQSGTVTIVATVTDTRGRSGSLPLNINVMKYSPPTISASSFFRTNSTGEDDPFGTSAKVQFKASVASLIVGGVQKNTLRYKIQSKQSNESTYVTKKDVAVPNKITVDASEQVVSYSVDYSYNFILTVTDLFNDTVVIGRLAIGQVTQHWGDKSTAFGMMLPANDRNAYFGYDGLKSYGVMIDKNDNEIFGLGGTIVEIDE